MPRKPTETQAPPEGKIIRSEMQDILHESMMNYAEYVLLDRALPRVEDGLKPVQRRILYTMYELSLVPDKPHRKCARIVGDALGKYHPHGDSSVYEALVRMGQWYNMGARHVDGQGNFGNIDGDPAAAMRYTEARLTPAAMEMLRGIDEDTVDFQLNFDDTLKEPIVLPCRFPNLLVNGATGIAVGLATSIPPHNPCEAIDATLAVIRNPDISLEKLMEKMPAPDFPTGGVLIPGEDLVTGYATGRGRAILRAVCNIETMANGRQLIAITEIPYQVRKSALLERIVKLSDEKKDWGVWDVRDESDRTGMRAVVELKKDANAEYVLNQLYKLTDLQTTVSINMVVIQDGKPVQLGVKAILQAYIAHQRQVVRRRTQHQLNQAEARAHILQGYIIAVDNIDAVVKLIRGSKSTKEAKVKLCETFALSEIQAQAVLDMPLRRLTALEIEELRREYEELCALIKKLEAILAHDHLLMELITSELQAMRKLLAVERRTRIVHMDLKAAVEPPPPAAISQPCVVIVRQNGYCKRVMLKTYQRVTPGEGTQDAAFLLSANTASRLLGVTNQGGLCWIAVEALPDGKPQDRGQPVANFCGGLDKGEQLLALFCVDEWPPEAELLLCTARGLVKRTAMADIRSKKAKLQGMTLKDDTLICAQLARPDDTVLMVSSTGLAVRFAVADAPTTGRTSGGVRGMSLPLGAMVIAASQVEDASEWMALTDAGYAKRGLTVEFDAQGRGGKGIKCFDFKKNGSNGTKLIHAALLHAPLTLSVTQKDGTQTRLASDNILVESRTGTGSLQVMTLMGNVITGVQRLLE